MDYLNVKDYGALGVDTPSADDTVAIQQAINNSVSENKPLYFPPGYYVIKNTLTKPTGTGFDTRGLNLVATPGAVTIDYSRNSAQPSCIRLIGGSGTLCQAKIDGFIFKGHSNSVALDIDGQCGQLIERCRFLTNRVGIAFNNQSQGAFTEWCTASNCYFDFSCQFALHYTKSGAGNNSFHGSGLTGVNYINTQSATVIQIDDYCLPYNCPLNAQVWFQSASAPNSTTTFIKNFNSNATYTPYFNGNITFEHFSGKLVLGDGKAMYFSGAIQAFGDYVSGGSLYQCRAVVANTNNVTTPYGLRWNMQSPISNAPFTISNNSAVGAVYQVFITIVGANYDYRCYGILDTTGSDGKGFFTKPDSAATPPKYFPVVTRNFNVAGYNEPVFSFSTSSDPTSWGRLIITNSSYPTPGQSTLKIYITFNQVADQFYGNYPAGSF